MPFTNFELAFELMMNNINKNEVMKHSFDVRNFKNSISLEDVVGVSVSVSPPDCRSLLIEQLNQHANMLSLRKLHQQRNEHVNMCETQVMEYQLGGILHAHTIGYVVKGFTNNNNE